MNPALMAEGMVPLLIVGGVVLIALIWVIGMYNALIRMRNTIDESWAQIDTELQRRYSLIPNLVNTVKGYAAHEKETLERVMQARNQAVNNHGTPSEQARDENILTGTLKSLFAVAEAYPNLKADQNFLQLQGELTNTEDRIQAARRFYNANVRVYDTKRQVFPSNIVAGMFSFEDRDYFEIDEPAVRETPKVEF